MRSGVYGKLRSWLCPLAAAVGLAATWPVQADEGGDPPIRLGDYELGQGLPLGSGFTLGGYATGRYDNQRGGDARLTLDHLSLMLWWEGSGRWKFFSEADYEEGFATRRQGADQERYLALERFYADYAFSDSASLRMGKFLAPIGRWNQIHADPLVWTTSRPLVTQLVFPGYATGGMVQGTLPMMDRELDYALFVSVGSGLRPKPNEDPFTDARGARINLPLNESLQLGASVAAFEQEASPGQQKRLLGLDFMWRRQRWEFTGEGVYRRSSDGPAEAEKGGFLQLVVPLTEHFHAVGRVEALRLAGAQQTTRNWVLGLNYRYSRGLALKAEVVRGRELRDGMPEGFLASLSILF